MTITPPGWFEDQMLHLVSQLVHIQAEEHAQARRLRTLIWTLFWLNVAAAFIASAVVVALFVKSRG